MPPRLPRRDARPTHWADPRLRRIAHRLTVPIEVTGDHMTIDDGGTHTWRDYKKLLWTGAGTEHDLLTATEDATSAVDAVILREEHHRQYGRPWALGKYIFEFVRSRGLQPADRLLDIGCGALRFGVLAIDYLDEGCYFGVDVHLTSLEAASSYEIPLHGLERKHPRLLWSDDFGFDHFGVQFDWALDFSTSVHVLEDDLARLFGRTSAVLRPGGRLLVSPEPRLARATLEGLGLQLVHEEQQECQLLAGHDFDHRNHWFEYERV